MDVEKKADVEDQKVSKKFAFKNRDVIVVILLIFFLVTIFFGAVAFDLNLEMMEYKHSADPIDRTIATAINCFIGLFCIGLGFAILDRLGLLRPIERDVREVIQQLQKRNGELFDAITKLRDEADEKIDKAVGILRGHDRFRSALIDFGMLGIAGVSAEPPHGDKTDYLSSIFVKELTEEESDKTIWYMNTFLEHTESMGSIISNAVLRGMRVHMLVLDPADDAMRGRYNDAYQKNPSYYGSDRDFMKKVTLDTKLLCNIEKSANERAAKHSPPSKGRMEIRFYKNSIGYPIVAVAEGRGTEIPERIYTGFYGAVSSEVMPYVEWGRGERPFLDSFFQIFVQKWDDQVTIRDIRSSLKVLEAEFCHPPSSS